MTYGPKKPSTTVEALTTYALITFIVTSSPASTAVSALSLNDDTVTGLDA